MKDKLIIQLVKDAGEEPSENAIVKALDLIEFDGGLELFNEDTALEESEAA